MCLQDEIDKHRKDIHTDGYPMSIGELVNLYRDKELDLHPEFQRFYRWSPQQKSRWIESILLGIPLPSFFVVQRDDGVWDVIDGLQRLSTILELMGELRTEEKQKWRFVWRIRGSFLALSWATAGGNAGGDSIIVLKWNVLWRSTKYRWPLL